MTLASGRGFQTALVLVVEDDDTGFVLDEDLVWVGVRQEFVVRAGQRTDLGSRPRVTSYLFDSWGGGTTRAFVLHDMLRRSRLVSNRDADAIMRLALLESDVPQLRADLLWAAVRLQSGLSDATAAERAEIRRLLPVGALLLAPVPIVAAWQHLLDRLEASS